MNKENASPPHVVDSGASVMGLDKERSLAGEITEGFKALERIRQLEAEIEALKDEVAKWKVSYENCHRMCSGYGMN